MSKAKSMAEAAIPAEKDEQARGRPEKSPLPISNTFPEGMKKPSASGESSMGGVKKGDSDNDASTHIGHAGMGHARRHLEKETERGAHVAEVGGHMMHEHSGRMGHKG